MSYHYQYKRPQDGISHHDVLADGMSHHDVECITIEVGISQMECSEMEQINRVIIYKCYISIPQNAYRFK